MPPLSFYLGLDLGQMQDHTALTVLQKFPASADPGREDGGAEHEYHARHVERLPLGTSYPAVVERVKAVLGTEPLASARPAVVVDVTGVGLPVFEMMEERGVANLRGVTIHAGDAVTRDGKIYRVPKRQLVSTVQVLLQSRRLKFAEGLRDGEVLRHELQNFKAKINVATGHDSYEAWREGDHDDLVLSLAMACWYAEQDRPAVTVYIPGVVEVPWHY